jgi:hypothetical protein
MIFYTGATLKIILNLFNYWFLEINNTFFYKKTSLKIDYSLIAKFMIFKIIYVHFCYGLFKVIQTNSFGYSEYINVYDDGTLLSTTGFICTTFSIYDATYHDEFMMWF